MSFSTATTAGFIPEGWLSSDSDTEKDNENVVVVSSPSSPTSWVAPDGLVLATEETSLEKKEKLTGIKKFFADLDDILLVKYSDKKNPKLAANLAFYGSVSQVLVLAASMTVTNEPVTLAIEGITAGVAVVNTILKARAIDRLEKKEEEKKKNAEQRTSN